jgi:hypothetical protein
MLANYDDFGDRRNRVLDYLLGIHGEAFSQRSLRNFDHYLADGDAEAELIRNKLKLLQSLVELSQRRAAAFNYREEAEHDGNCAALVRKVGILLGLRIVDGGHPTAVFRERGLSLVDDGAEDWQSAAATTADLEDAVGVRERPLGESQGEDRLFREVAFLNEGHLSIALLRHGIDLDRYRVAPAAGTFDVLFRKADDDAWYRIATGATRAAAVDLVHDLRALLIRLNAESERILLVEHILLRPRGAQPHAFEVAADYYPFRLSVIFPAWSARFAEEKFRNLAEETVRLNCPAHLHAEFHWLDFAAMAEFEGHHARWLAALRRHEGKPGADPAEIDAASASLIAVLASQGAAVAA